MEDKIRDLCEQAVAENDPAELRRILVKLRDALHQQIGRFRTKLSAYPVTLERRDRPSKDNFKTSGNNPH